ncbi:MAG: 30S ribosomal protein S17 [Candidatus Portnoybacteria bacterium RBG_13_40_8]|uniref:Small ribosomal subunit protein uS17 n=1 Tax=Candidatus Portnoybacteria bacterium RBG_13_40_8 TaxID=1801990 RepID=A0A1G2F4H0_9BACT|nr:MAG: 30S ribosomal protein S17 [Candidatus Portnoybacteria bacterium RBG_13_40_8]OGZ35567.1 MAG: 30S ribosomal protein S17 [Candidatus Portnoybacteria bacterium RIFCSPHIGHO2_01_FULL_39_19]
MNNQNKANKRTLKGTVVSDKMDKTIVVLVERIKEHRQYRRRYRVSKKYKVHDPEKKFKIGDRVSIQECKPISKEKRWIVL